MYSVLAVLALVATAFAAPQAATGATTAPAAGQTIPVTIGNGAIAFNPSQVTANVGDVIEFTFFPKNHSLTQSTFANPCTPAFNASTGQAGFDSGFMFTNATGGGPTLKLQVTTTTPLWFFCRQTGHCAMGMVFAVNPTPAKNFTAFQQMAMQQGPTNAPVAVGSSAPAASAAPAAGGAAPAAGASTDAGASSAAGAAPIGGSTIATDSSSASSTGSGSAAAPTSSTPGAASSVSVARAGVLVAALLAGAALL